MLAAVLSEDGERDEHQGNVGQPPGRAVVHPEADGHEAGGEGQGKSGGEDDFTMSYPAFVERQATQGDDDSEEVKRQEGAVPSLDNGVAIVFTLPFQRDEAEDDGCPIGRKCPFGEDEQGFAGFHGCSFG